MRRCGGLSLHDNQVDVWLESVSEIGEAERTAWRCFLSKTELSRWCRFRRQKAQDQYLLGRALLRVVLSSYADTPRNSWRFAENCYGRPYVAKPKAFQYIKFNISHTDGLVALVVSRTCETGIDVENHDSNLDVYRLARSCLSPIEARTVEGLLGNDAIRAFYYFWTLKEAYLKARGRGLSIPLESFWFDIAKTPPAFQCSNLCDENPGRWQFHLFAPSYQHTLALAVGASLRQDIRFLSCSLSQRPAISAATRLLPPDIGMPIEQGRFLS